MPAEFVIETVDIPVCTFKIVTFTPGSTAAVLSVTVPLISPVFAFCAKAVAPNRVRSSIKPTRALVLRPVVLIVQPPKFNQRSDWVVRKSCCRNSLNTGEKSTKNNDQKQTCGDSMPEDRLRETDESRKEQEMTAA